jgi:hypothetical protein
MHKLAPLSNSRTKEIEILEYFNFDKEELPEDAFPTTYANIAKNNKRMLF